MANYIKGTAIQENSISETKLDSSLQSWKETVTNHINNNDNPHNITKSSIGLDNVTNDAQVKRSELGVANGVATLDSTGKVPSGQLPSYVDDVIEGYLYNGVFYKDTSYTTSIVGESGKIYIDLPTNKTYRWTGSVYGVISETIALGETSSTAYRGDRGKIAYDHSQSAHAPSNAQANIIETIKVNGTALTPNSKAVDITIPTVGNGTITIKQGGTSKGTFTTNQNGNTTIELTDTNTTYTAGDGLSLSGTTFSNNGVRSIATGTTNGTISVNTNGNISNIGVYGLKSAAYTNSSDYAAASHTHSYLPLAGGTMSNTNKVTNLNADLLDGYHKNDILRKTEDPTSVISLNNVVTEGIDFTSWGYAHSANINNQPLGDGALSAASVVSFGTPFSFQIYSDYNDTDKLFYRSYYINNGWKAWRQFAFLDSNVASSSKWANARTITLTGSVTGSVSIDGSSNVSLATTTNHTHTFASLTSKPTTLSEYGITDALTHKYITHKEDFQCYVILLCKIGTNTTKNQHTINGTFWTNGNGSSRYNAAYINVHCSDWSNNHNEYYSFTPFGLDKKCRLVTCTYQSSQYLAITFEGTQATYIYFDGSYSNILFTPILYYTANTSTANNSEIYNSITEVGYSKIPLISSAETALTSSNYNSYAPKLDGTGATGTWGINISGNAAGLSSEYLSDLNSASYNKVFSGGFKVSNRPAENYATGLTLYNKELKYLYQLAFSTNGNLFARYYGSSWNSWKTIAFTDSNVASATKLQNSRTIWGQSFDGTGDVSGALSGVTNITASGHAKVYSLKTDHICIECDNSGNSSSRGSEINNYDGHLYLQHDTSNNCFICSGGGNVSIGTTSSSYKLHVAGSILSDLGNSGGVLIGRYGNTIDGYANGTLTDLHLNYTSSGNLTMCKGGGNVGIGTTTPSYKLDVAGAIRASYYLSTQYIELIGSTPFIDFHYNNSTADYTSRIIEDASGQLTVIGKLRIGSDYTTSDNYTFHVTSGDSFFYDNVITGSDFSSRGDAIIDGTVSCTKLVQTSDIKYKTNIKQIKYEEALKIIENLNPVTWDWNENTIVTGSSSGFVAQEAEEFIPNAISRDNENNLSLDYTQLHSYEIRVIQEQQKEIKDLKQRLEVLENLVLQLTNKEI